MKKPICLIYSNDGFDEGERFNLSLLYKRMGFIVVSSFKQKMTECNLLVIARGSDVPTELISKKTPVHIYAYVGSDIKPIIFKLRNNPYVVIAPSSKIIESNGVENTFGAVAMPPVYTRHWSIGFKHGVLPKVEFRFVHIGNRKTAEVSASDIYNIGLEKVVKSGIVHVWGKGWQNISHLPSYNGSISVYNLKYIYARTAFALGIMYPFQRDMETFSGRFWQAPLNGAVLLSEPNKWIGKIPGVIEIDHSYSNINKDILFNREVIMKMSTIFWRNETNKLEYMVKEYLNKYPPTDNNISIYKIENLLQELSWLKRKTLAFSERVKIHSLM